VACPTPGVGAIVASRSALPAMTWHHPVMGRTVLVVDDHTAFLDAAQALLVADGFEVIGRAITGAGALDAHDRLHPDVVLLDIRLPDIDGITVAERLAERAEPPAVVLVSSREATVYGARLRDSPARGFLLKGDLSGAALRRLLDG
jgi:DNA-binding NarL/FixJ family response regulator